MSIILWYILVVGMQMKLTIETHILGSIYADAHASNAGNSAGVISGNIALGAAGTPLVVTKANALEIIVDMGQVLDEQNVPETDRFLILPAWFIALLKKTDLKDAALTGDSVSPMRNGKVGSVDRFTLYNSNLLARTASDGGCTYPLFGHKMASTFVSQLTKVEQYRPQDTFADAIKGLNVYGFKCLQPIGLGYLYCKKG